jgi:AraC-like DNA-binding protein
MRQAPDPGIAAASPRGHGAPAKVAPTILDFAPLPQGDRLDAWCEAMRPLWTITPAADTDLAAPAALELMDLGPAMLGAATAPAMRFERALQLVRASGLDQILVQVYSDGGFAGQCDDRDMTLRPGDIGFLDLARAFRTDEPASRSTTLVVPRERLLPLMPAGGVHGRTLDGTGATVRLIRAHLITLHEVAGSLTPTEAAAAADAAILMIAGAWQQLRDAEPQARSAATATLRRVVCAHIERHLTDERLDADELLRAFRLSRSTLYRLFEADGGVAAYIQRRRLQRCFDILSRTPDRRITIGSIAYEHGFSSEAHFSRAFHRRFGLRPSELREKARSAATGETQATPDHARAAALAEWLVRFRQAPD